MFIIGNNIKKIRTVKKLNQSEFGKLFALSRASIGSYEEGRADPKIEKIIEIAKYFSIELNSFLKKELSVNEISGFKLTDKKMVLGSGNNLLERKIDNEKKVIYISNKAVSDFVNHIKTNDKWRGREIVLPPTVNRNTTIAFEHNDNAMDINNNGIAMSDVVFGEKIDLANVFDGYMYIVVLKDSIFLRKISISEESIKLNAINVNFQPKVISINDVLEYYKITAVIKNSINHFMRESE